MTDLNATTRPAEWRDYDYEGEHWVDGVYEEWPTKVKENSLYQETTPEEEEDPKPATTASAPKATSYCSVYRSEGKHNHAFYRPITGLGLDEVLWEFHVTVDDDIAVVSSKLGFPEDDDREWGEEDIDAVTLAVEQKLSFLQTNRSLEIGLGHWLGHSQSAIRRGDGTGFRKTMETLMRKPRFSSSVPTYKSKCASHDISGLSKISIPSRPASYKISVRESRRSPDQWVPGERYDEPTTFVKPARGDRVTLDTNLTTQLFDLIQAQGPMPTYSTYFFGNETLCEPVAEGD